MIELLFSPSSTLMLRRVSIGLVLLLLGPMLPASAQSVWTTPPRHADQISVEWLKPLLNDGDDVSVLTSAFVLSAQITLTDQAMFVGELPIAHARFNSLPQFRDAETPSTSAGNPYFGLEVRSPDAPLFLEVGFRPPTTENPGVLPSAIGSLSDLNRLSAYVVDQIPFQLVGNYYYDPASSPLSAGLRVGPEVFFPATGDASATMVLTYGAQGWYTDTDGRLRAGVGLTGRWNTGREAGFGESSLHHVTTTLQGTFGHVQPGVVVRFPLEASYREGFEAVIGLTMTVSLSEGPDP